jgi:hypothetical protein
MGKESHINDCHHQRRKKARTDPLPIISFVMYSSCSPHPRQPHSEGGGGGDTYPHHMLTLSYHPLLRSYPQHI